MLHILLNLEWNSLPLLGLLINSCSSFFWCKFYTSQRLVKHFQCIEFPSLYLLHLNLVNWIFRWMSHNDLKKLALFGCSSLGKKIVFSSKDCVDSWNFKRTLWVDSLSFAIRFVNHLNFVNGWFRTEARKMLV